MTRRNAILLMLAGLSSAAPTAVSAVVSPSGIDSRLRLEWEAREDRGGRPVITGYIYNDSGQPAINLRLMAEALDASGQVVDRAIGFVTAGVPAFNRSYFSVSLHKAGAAYRIAVTGFDWKNNGF
jgi:hypothetical protein